MILAAATAEPSRGWGGPLAILAAFAAFRLLMPVMRRLRDKIGNPSPPPALTAGSRLKAEATIGVTDDDTDRVQAYGWGSIGYERSGPVEPDAEPDAPPVGWRTRLAQARQVVTTGSHVLPEPDAEPVEEAIDLALDDEQDDEQDDGETAEEYIRRARDMQVQYSAIVRAVVRIYNVSESTAKRRIREVDAERA